MPSASLLYMVISGLAFAGLDLVRKLLAGRIDALGLVFYMSLGATPFLLGLLAVRGVGDVSAGYIAPGLGATALNFVGSLGFIYSVKLSPLSRTIPLLSLTPAFTALLAIPILGELPDARQGLGILLVVLGAMALNSDGHSANPFTGDRGALLMTGVAFVWSLSGPFDKLSLEHASVPFHAAVMTFGVGAGAIATLVFQRRLSVLREISSHKRLLGAAVLSLTLALVFQLLAFQSVFVSLVEAFKRSTGSLMALVLGRIVFHEHITRVRMLAVGVMVIGVVLILI